MDGVVTGVEPHGAVAEEDERPDVARRQAVDPHRLLRRLDQVLDAAKGRGEDETAGADAEAAEHKDEETGDGAEETVGALIDTRA